MCSSDLPTIARWNLARFAETLLSLIDDTTPDHAMAEATDVIDGFMPRYEALWLSGARAKLGLTTAAADSDEDSVLVNDWLDLLEQHSVDFTLAWRRLADAAKGNLASLEVLLDRKSTRLNSSHVVISYAVFCLKKKIEKTNEILLLTTHRVD